VSNRNVTNKASVLTVRYLHRLVSELEINVAKLFSEDRTDIGPVGAAVMGVAGVDDPQLLVQELNLDEVVTAQRSLPWWRDRRPDLYKHLV
jgi:hypothetical protein